MKQVIFDDDEMRVISCFDTGSRKTALIAVEDVVSFIEDDEELRMIVLSTIKKLNEIHDEDFTKLDFELYRAENEEENEG